MRSLKNVFQVSENLRLTTANLDAIISNVGYARVLELADRHV